MTTAAPTQQGYSDLDGATHDLWAAANGVDRRRARSRQVSIGASDVGECRRRTAYRVHRTPTTDDPGDKRMAILGTWIHAGYLGVMRQEYGAVTEVKLATEKLQSSADAYYPDAYLVEDGKTVAYSLDRQRIYGPRVPQLFQVHIYGDLLRRGLLSPRERRLTGPQPVTDVRVRFICRANGDEHVHQQPYDPEITARAWAWLDSVLATERPEDAPRDLPGPGLSAICDSCPFRSQCWPDQGDQAPQSILVRDDADVAAALADYERARIEEAEAKEQKAYARARLDGAAPGVYGDWALSWGGGAKPAGAGGTEPDVAEMIALLEAANVEIPRRAKRPKAATISVRRAPETARSLS